MSGKVLPAGGDRCEPAQESQSWAAPSEVTEQNRQKPEPLPLYPLLLEVSFSHAPDLMSS